MVMVDRGRKLAVAGLLAGCVQACAPPLVPPPLCGNAGVLRQVDETLRARGRTMVIEAPPVGEVSTDPAAALPSLAHCAVQGHTVGYDTNRYGASPVYEPFIVNYTVETRRNGLFVRVD